MHALLDMHLVSHAVSLRCSTVNQVTPKYFLGVSIEDNCL